MKTHLKELLDEALMDLRRQGVVPEDAAPELTVERTRNPDHGHFASNLAMVLGKAAGSSPRELAQRIKDQLPDSPHVDKVEIAGPGFINFFLTPGAFQALVREINDAGGDYGRSEIGKGERVTVEFVSANPTGPLHVGHGRGAAFGASVGNVLAASGFDVHREYYVNDYGRQMNILAASVWLRYLELCGEKVRFPDNGYRGDYIYDIARDLRERHGDAFRHGAETVYDDMPADEEQGGDKEKHVDALVGRARQLLGEDGYRICFDTALDAILDDIREDLAGFGVVFDEWFSERSLYDTGAIRHAIERLDERGHLYEEDGATWFRATEFGDRKDRVVVRKNGDTTYFASDIAYFLNKMERGFDHAVYVLGADHHGYIQRLKAAASGLGADPDQMEILLVQFAILYRGGTKLPMSTRSGEFVTLRQLREEVGKDAARYFYVSRSNDQHLDFDLDLAKAESADNPVYYIQYAHARIASVFEQLKEKGLDFSESVGDAALDRLTEPHEMQLLEELGEFPDIVAAAARGRAPHLVAHYLREVANRFHTWYNACTFLVDDENVRAARLNLCRATRQVLANGLALLDVSAPEKM